PGSRSTSRQPSRPTPTAWRPSSSRRLGTPAAASPTRLARGPKSRSCGSRARPDDAIRRCSTCSLVEPGETPGDVAAGIGGGPSLRADEQTYGGESGLLSHVEPVRQPRGYSNEVAPLAQHRRDLAPRVKDEQAAPLHEEAHFVLRVRVLV